MTERSDDEGRKMRGRLLGLVAVLGLLIASCGGAAPESTGAPIEGVQVHGDWVIDVYNPDGTLNQHREFSNSLESGDALVDWAAHVGSVGPWSVSLFSADQSTYPCVSTTSQPTACTMIEAFNPGAPDSPSLSSTLVVSAEADNYGFLHLFLRGSHTASATGEISHVQTNASVCGPDEVFPDISCAQGHTDTFTATDLDTPIPVTEGQMIQVEVQISFTSG
jgi:hypothetical protein